MAAVSAPPCQNNVRSFTPSFITQPCATMRSCGRSVRVVVASDTWLRERPPIIEVPVIHQVLEPVNLPLEHPAVQRLAAAYREALGTDPEFGGLPRPCDATIISEASITTVAFGPGDLAMNAY